MFKRKLTSETETVPTAATHDAFTAALQERACLMQKTLSHSAVYTPEKPEMTIGEGTSVSGQICFDRLLRIEGQFKGEILSDGKLEVGVHGDVTCHINLESAVIEGKVTGNITVTKHLQLLGNAKVYGDISAESLTVEPGVTLVGQVCVRTKEDAPFIDTNSAPIF